MSIVIYTKKGKRSYKENRLIDKIKPIIEKQLDENPELYGKFRPATNFDELQKLHDMYTSDDVDFEEIDENDNNKNMAKGKNDFEETSDEENLTDSLGLDDDDDDDGYNDFVDPFNREEPIVRDYVTDGVSMEPGGDVKNTGQNEFQEPTSFDEAFELDTDGDQLTEKTRSNQSQGKQQQEQRRERPQRAERSEPLNPNFDDMSSGKKKRSTKKFAKYIVETTCMLSEKGFVWYANKEINDSKLTEYELSGEMDLSLLVTLEDGQEVTVKQFFQVQCLKAEQLAVIDKEEKEDLAEALDQPNMDQLPIVQHAIKQLNKWTAAKKPAPFSVYMLVHEAPALLDKMQAGSKKAWIEMRSHWGGIVDAFVDEDKSEYVTDYEPDSDDMI